MGGEVEVRGTELGDDDDAVRGKTMARSKLRPSKPRTGGVEWSREESRFRGFKDFRGKGKVGQSLRDRIPAHLDL